MKALIIANTCTFTNVVLNFYVTFSRRIKMNDLTQDFPEEREFIYALLNAKLRAHVHLPFHI